MVADTSCSSGIVVSDAGATPSGPRVNWHPALLKLLEYVDTANGGMSLSKMDKGKLIQLLLVPELAHVLVAENMRTCRDLERLQLEYIAGTGRGFLTTTFVIEGYPPQVLYHRDIMRELARMFGHQRNAKDFRFRPKVVVDGETKERVYTTAETGTWWNEAQAFVGPEVVIAALLFYSDVTHLSNNGRKKAHPVMMTLANIPLPKRWGKAGHSLLALLPIPPKGMPSRVKTELFNKCIAKIMEPIRQAKERGVMLEDAIGDLHKVIPMFYGWACDYPESGKITGTLSGQGCSKPCSLCYVDKENLSSVHLENNMRTPELQQLIRDQPLPTTRPRAESSLKRFSTFDVDCALWMWTVEGTLWGNPYLAVMPDIMHQADLGLLDHIVRSIRMLIPASLPTLDQRLKDLRGVTRISSMRLPSNEYFVSGAQTAAFEHRAVMQILIFLVADKLGASQLEAIRAYLTWYLACYAPSHTEESLRALQEYSERLVELLKLAFPKQASAWNLVKTHLMTHFAQAIRRAGYVHEYSTNTFEHLHGPMLKQVYRRSNKRNADSQIMKHHEMRLDFALVEENENARQMAMQKAIEEGRRVMTKDSYSLQVDPTEFRSRNWFAQMWAQQHVEAHIQFKSALARRQLAPATVRAHTTLAIPAAEDVGFARTAHFVKATPKPSIEGSPMTWPLLGIGLRQVKTQKPDASVCNGRLAPPNIQSLTATR
ncbi:unnamed protein product [Closterium sp. Yama58-4]|nr:unnamed protein product [Closterium sp. Yama58-4]